MSDHQKITWWMKHKNKVYGIILMISGAFGGNADRLLDMIPTSPDTMEKLESHDQRLDNLENRAKLLEGQVFGKSQIRDKDNIIPINP